MNKMLLQIAFITGRSFRGNTQLSPAQLAFINQLARPGRNVVTLNFPYCAGENGASAYQPVGLLTASINNSLDYVTSRRGSFQRNYDSPVMELLALAQHTVFLSGSCGLELFNNLHLPAELMGSTSLIAYGPVARQRPRCRHVLVQGDRDWISRIWFGRSDYKISSGHMNYLANPALLALCEQFISNIESTGAM